MRFFPLEPTSRTAANLRRLERDLGLRIIEEMGGVDKIVIIGDGTPDDIVLPFWDMLEMEKSFRNFKANLQGNSFC